MINIAAESVAELRQILEGMTGKIPTPEVIDVTARVPLDPPTIPGSFEEVSYPNIPKPYQELDYNFVSRIGGFREGDVVEIVSPIRGDKDERGRRGIVKDVLSSDSHYPINVQMDGDDYTRPFMAAELKLVMPVAPEEEEENKKSLKDRFTDILDEMGVEFVDHYSFVSITGPFDDNDDSIKYVDFNFNSLTGDFVNTDLFD